MRVLWFEVTVPGRYKSGNAPVGGWQDSLQNCVERLHGLELGIAFEYAGKGEVRKAGAVTYFPINTHYNLWERQRRGMSWDIVIEKVNPRAIEIVHEFKPDIIHVFGSEWSFGMIAEQTDIPVVIHMQGCIMPYDNAFLPPTYSLRDQKAACRLNLKRRLGIWKGRRCAASRAAMEMRNFKAVKYYMGRTDWDESLVELFHPGAKYYYCSEALRPSFMETAKPWSPHKNEKFRIVTTGAGILKGIDTILKAAKLLKDYRDENGLPFEFQWILAGCMSPVHKKMIEKKEGLKYEDCNIILSGFIGPDELQKTLLSANLYVHSAYIDNSPNSVCEAQYLGLPIIATYAGGIPSLIENGKEGILIHTNAPYMLASKIIRLSKDEELCRSLGEASRKRAMERHKPENIVKDLFACYEAVIKDSKN